MKLSGLHLLLTYECNMECDHCFVWGSPWNCGTMTLENIRKVLKQARYLGTVESIYFEGGEPFLYYPVLIKGVKEALQQGFKVGVVTNGYWATSPEDARLWLEPFAGKVEDLSLSSDLFHGGELVSRRTEAAARAAAELSIPAGIITIRRQEELQMQESLGQLPIGESSVMHRGRAAEKLVEGLPRLRWADFRACPHEDLREPGRVHIDPLGYLHICQGISLGNLFQTDLREICQGYDPDTHPITGPLLRGGPAELVRRYELNHQPGYVDACHLCYRAREKLRTHFPEILAPDQMYGVLPSS